MITVILLFLTIIGSDMNTMEHTPDLADYCKILSGEFDKIDGGRVQTLKEVGDFIIGELEQERRAQLLFICTHNSRRSQYGQIWALFASEFYGIENIRTFSGGTESTAFNPRAVSSLERAGFMVSVDNREEDNPHYSFQSGTFMSDEMYSKLYSDPGNSQENFCALMVCSQADEACPFVPGAAERISLPYEDPKKFDGTEREDEAYDERCRQIGREMFYVMNYVRSRIF